MYSATIWKVFFAASWCATVPRKIEKMIVHSVCELERIKVKPNSRVQPTENLPDDVGLLDQGYNTGDNLLCS